MLKPKLAIKTQQEVLFNKKLKALVGTHVSFKYSDQLCHFPSPNFFDLTPRERYNELYLLRIDANFERVLHTNYELTWLFLRKSIADMPDLITDMKKNRLGRQFLIPMELEPWQIKMSEWLGTNVSLLFSSGIYHYLSSDFIEKTPQDRYAELYRLRLNPDFMSCFEQNAVCYLFLRKSVDDTPELISQLKTNRLGQHYLIPEEQKRFNQQMSKMLGERVSRKFSDELFNHLTPNFFAKTPEDKYIELYAVRKKQAFVECLWQEKDLSDKFLRKSMNDSPDLIARLRTNRLGQYFLIPEIFGQFNKKMKELMGEEVPRVFTDELFKHLPTDYFDKSPENRYTVLCNLITTTDFFNCLIQNKANADSFLRRSLDDSPELIAQLNINPLTQQCLLPSRRVRKRKLEEKLQPQSMSAEKAFIERLVANSHGNLFSNPAEEKIDVHTKLALN